VGKPAISYTSHPGATPDSEISALANVYRLLLDCHANKNAAGVPSTNGDDAERRSDEIGARASIQRTA
jgi:hypothetical protein